jgi:hypothetical protein
VAAPSIATVNPIAVYPLMFIGRSSSVFVVTGASVIHPLGSAQQKIDRDTLASDEPEIG